MFVYLRSRQTLKPKFQAPIDFHVPSIKWSKRGLNSLFLHSSIFMKALIHKELDYIGHMSVGMLPWQTNNTLIIYKNPFKMP